MDRGILISIEGNDGAGKTTAARAVARALEARGIDVLETREPGGSPVAEQIRSLLLDCDNAMDPMTEALLYAASRREHLTATIRPALEEGKVVLCDRFLDSSLAYQGCGRQLGMQTVEEINEYALQGFRPALTLFFAIDEETGRKRMVQRGDMNRLDLESEAFYRRVREGFEQLALQHPERFVRIDASQSPRQVADDALQAVLGALKKAGYDR